jgi:hypothetical protein
MGSIGCVETTDTRVDALRRSGGGMLPGGKLSVAA